MPTLAERQATWEATRAMYRAAVEKHGGVVAAARALGVAHSTISTSLKSSAVRNDRPSITDGRADIPDSTSGGRENVPDRPLDREQAARVVGAASAKATLGRLAALLERSGIPLEEIARVEKIRVNEWDGFSKDAEGNPVITRLQGESIVLAPKWADGPAWPVVERGPACNITPIPRPARADDGIRRAVVLPDMQINFYVGRDGSLVPTHDEACLQIALDVITDADPHVVAMNGDNLDLSQYGRYRKMPVFQRMAQPTIDRATRLMASIRARVRPETQIIWLEGNHELRLPIFIIDNASEAFGLRRGNAPDSWPVMSVPFLCRLDEFGVEYVAGYPSNEWMLNDNLAIGHGSKVKTGGSTAHAYLPELRYSLCYGHVHREEFGSVTRKTLHGPRTYEAFSFGCLCKTTGVVPGAESGFDVHGQPVKAQNNWTNGLGVIEYEPGDGHFWREHVRIWNGRARWRGKTYVAPDELAEAA